ncbi:MAG: hypothetical protein WAU91_11415, partial [Desulfatitalea sp.]
THHAGIRRSGRAAAQETAASEHHRKLGRREYPAILSLAPIHGGHMKINANAPVREIKRIYFEADVQMKSVSSGPKLAGPRLPVAPRSAIMAAIAENSNATRPNKITGTQSGLHEEQHF